MFRKEHAQGEAETYIVSSGKVRGVSLFWFYFPASTMYSQRHTFKIKSASVEEKSRGFDLTKVGIKIFSGTTWDLILDLLLLPLLFFQNQNSKHFSVPSVLGT